MSLVDVLKKHEIFLQKRLYTIKGNIVPLGDGTVKIKFNSYAYVLVSEKDIDPFLIFPLISGEDPSGRGSKHAIKLFEGTIVELHVKNLVHTFTMENSTHPFYVDISKEKIVYLNTDIESNLHDICYKRVYIVDCHCCTGGYLEECYGWVGCSDEWYDERCCHEV
ncbi:hypothetical protein IAW_05985 [Bacillus cereus str. Schrouff]|uniref:hypothetical protein n=1 Tax=Bacillus cereus TaxID=1396 RepID=UPI00033020FC|nr:hypothetical protein [Bacillus cereus]EOO04781.1 hypothetical protein IAW_05985 [Bacillus cereus str. Schrouff]EOO80805.1 hypothetical protein IGY_06171 [Bacillus cereus K-5975c]